MKKIIFIVFVTCFSTLAEVAPDFPEPHHFFDSSIIYPNEISHVFNGRNNISQEKIGASIAHQNREWEYNWFLFGLVIPVVNNNIIALGYSNYGTNSIPIVSSDQVGSYLSSYDSDTFETIYLSYMPGLSELNIQMLMNYKRRRLISQKASALHIDFKLSSQHILNNQVGIRTTNLIGSEYKWSTGTIEKLAKYVGIYFTQPISIFTILYEYDYSLNYTDLSVSMLQAAIKLDDSLSVFASYRQSTTFSSLSFGSNIRLSEVFNLTYANKNESNENLDLSIHALSIGVKF